MPTFVLFLYTFIKVGSYPIIMGFRIDFIYVSHPKWTLFLIFLIKKLIYFSQLMQKRKGKWKKMIGNQKLVESKRLLLYAEKHPRYVCNFTIHSPPPQNPLGHFGIHSNYNT